MRSFGPADRQYVIARIALALGVAGYTQDECVELMTWVSGLPAKSESACVACEGAGRHGLQPDTVRRLVEHIGVGDHLTTAMFRQGICLACRGTGRVR